MAGTTSSSSRTKPRLGPSFPDLCFIWVFVKISRNFAVKFSVGVTFMFCSRLNRPPTLATPSAKSTAGTCVLILIFAQHELIGEISKTQGNSQGWAPVLFINLVRILQLSRSADHEFDLSCCVIFSSVSTSVVS